MSTARTLTKAVVTNTVALTETLTLASDPVIGTVTLSPSAGQRWTMDGTTGPAATRSVRTLVTMSGGTATIDLTAFPDAETNVAVDLTGLKIKMLHLAAPSANANAVTVKPGASNGYTGWTVTGDILNASDQRGPSIFNGGIAVDATHKTIDITGTGAQQVTIVALFG